MNKSIMLLVLLVIPTYPTKLSTLNESIKTPININAHERSNYQSMNESMTEEDVPKVIFEDLEDEQKECCAVTNVIVMGIVKVAELVVLIINMTRK